MDNRIKGVVAGAAGAFATVASRMGVAAQDTTAAGNGGTADASANGGVVSIGDVNSGGNSGSGISVGDVGSDGDDGKLVCDKYGKCYHVDGDDGSGGAVAIDGGDVTTSTSLTLSADGGVAISDASGGDDNDAVIADIVVDDDDDMDFAS